LVPLLMLIIKAFQKQGLNWELQFYKVLFLKKKTATFLSTLFLKTVAIICLLTKQRACISGTCSFNNEKR
jgi:hypothetical protein